MLEIDGSVGEGGGQILRTSMALSVLTQTPIHITRIRAGREKPGLQRQHLVAVQAAARISNGEISGDELNSTELTFRPGLVVPGPFRFSTGSAGSTTLVLQTILPMLWNANGPSRVTLEGGTHNPWAPPFDFLVGAFLPLIERMGPRITVKLDRHGFYPRGGGSITVEITPTPTLQPFCITERGSRLKYRAQAVVLGLPKDIADREAAALRRYLNWPGNQVEAVVHADRLTTGNYIAVKLDYEHVSEVFTGLGALGVRGEDIARKLAKEVKEYLSAEVPVGEYLADQLLLPMALAGRSEFVTLKPSLHSTTNIEIIQKFLNVTFFVTELPDGKYQISVTQNSTPREPSARELPASSA